MPPPPWDRLRRHAAGCLYSRRVNAEFNWWLLIVGLVIGAGLTWLVLADSSRREVDIEDRELDAESRWIADALADLHQPLDDERVLDVLRLHRAYRAAAPPDEIEEPDAISDGDPATWIDPGERGPMAHPIGPVEPDRPDPGRPDRGPVQEPGGLSRR
jgi:hypothetical protein